MTSINRENINIFLSLIDKLQGAESVTLTSSSGSLYLKIERIGAVLTPYAKGVQYAFTQSCESYGKLARIKEMRFLCIRSENNVNEDLQIFPYYFFPETTQKPDESIVFDDNGMYCIFVRRQPLHALVANNWLNEIEQMKFNPSII